MCSTGTFPSKDDTAGQQGVAQVKGTPNDKVVVVQLEDGTGEEEKGQDFGNDQRQSVGRKGCQEAHVTLAANLQVLHAVDVRQSER